MIAIVLQVLLINGEESKLNMNYYSLLIRGKWVYV
jgi:hypothetical protein